LIAGAGPLKRLDVAASETFVASLGPRFVTFRVNVAVPLPGLPVVAALCVSERSASVRIVPHACDELLLEMGSVVVDPTDAVLHRSPPAVAPAPRRTVSVKLAVAPEARLAIEQLTPTGPAVPTDGLAHDQPTGEVSDWNVVPAGMVSVTETAEALLRPLFRTVIV
jgi:hypothetical protein